MADDDGVKKDPNDPAQRLTRAEAMAVVMENRMKNLRTQDGVDDTPVTTAAPAPGPGEGEVNLDPGAQVERQTDQPLILADDDLSKYMVRTKVMGEERMVPLSELRATAQKNDAADVYLRQAKEILDDARIKAAAIPAATVATTSAAPETAIPAAAKPAEVDGMVDSFVDEVFKGNIDEAKRVLKQAIVTARPTEQVTAALPNLDQLAVSVEQKVVVRSALRQFAKDYPAIYADPVARRVADDFLAKATEGKPLEAFPEEQIGTILKDTGQRVIAWTRGLAGVPANGSTATTRIDKEQRKEAIDELPTAATRATTVVVPPKTTSDVINAMKVARGQLRDPTQP